MGNELEEKCTDGPDPNASGFAVCLRCVCTVKKADVTGQFRLQLAVKNGGFRQVNSSLFWWGYIQLLTGVYGAFGAQFIVLAQLVYRQLVAPATRSSVLKIRIMSVQSYFTDNQNVNINLWK